MRQAQRLGRRELLLGGAATGAGMLAAGVPSAQAQESAEIEWLDYDPPRPFAAGARVGNVVYLSGVTGAGADIAEQTQSAFANIQRSLQALDSDLAHIFKMVVYLVDMADQPGLRTGTDRFLARPVASTAVAVSRLVLTDALVEIDVMAVVPNV